MRARLDRRTLLAASAAAVLARPAIGKPARLALANDLDAAIGRAVAADLAPGLAVALYSREGVYVGAFGVADRATGAAATPDTCFYVASTTKSLTALALAILDRRGAFSLD